MAQRSIWGISVDTEQPTTGVYVLHNLDLYEEIDYRSEDPDYSRCLQDAQREYLYEQGKDADEIEALLAEEDSDLIEGFDLDGFNSCYEQTTVYIGMKQDEKGLYEPDPEADFSAIVNLDSNTVQVLASRFFVRAAQCSPCYPGQADGDTPGEFLAYCVPPEYISDHDESGLTERIFKKNWTGYKNNG